MLNMLVGKINDRLFPSGLALMLLTFAYMSLLCMTTRLESGIVANPEPRNITALPALPLAGSTLCMFGGATIVIARSTVDTRPFVVSVIDTESVWSPSVTSNGTPKTTVTYVDSPGYSMNGSLGYWEICQPNELLIDDVMETVLAAHATVSSFWSRNWR